MENDKHPDWHKSGKYQQSDNNLKECYEKQ